MKGVAFSLHPLTTMWKFIKFFPVLLLLIIANCGRPEDSSQTLNQSSQDPKLPPAGAIIDIQSPNTSNAISFTPGSVVITYQMGNECLNGVSGGQYTVYIRNKAGADALEFVSNILPAVNHSYLLNQEVGLNWVYDSTESIGAISNCVDESCNESGNPGSEEASDSIKQATLTYLAAPSTNGSSAAISFSITYSDGKVLSGTANAPVAVSGVTGGGCN